MILVTLGTQDKSFTRLLKAIDREIEKGTIKDKVIVQAGYTKYKSKNMEIFDLISSDKFDELMSKANLVITHGGAGSILTAIQKDKKVIAAPREKRYKEHTNDHQKELIKEFEKEGYILAVYDMKNLEEVLKKSKRFKPKKFVSNTNHMIELISNYIKEDNHISWWNRYSDILLYTSFFVFFYFIFTQLKIDNIYNPLWIGLFFFNFLINKYIVFRDNRRNMISTILQFFSYTIATFGILLLSTINEIYFVNVFIYFLISLFVYKKIIFKNKFK